jgi:hypothetical protein
MSPAVLSLQVIIAVGPAVAGPARAAFACIPPKRCGRSKPRKVRDDDPERIHRDLFVYMVERDRGIPEQYWCNAPEQSSNPGAGQAAQVMRALAKLLSAARR